LLYWRRLLLFLALILAFFRGALGSSTRLLGSLRRHALGWKWLRVVLWKDALALQGLLLLLLEGALALQSLPLLEL